MVKFIETKVVFEEIPDEITLAINITNCQNNCIGCHSPYLKENIGDILSDGVLDDLIRKNNGITCVCFMGEGNDKETLFGLVKYVRGNFPLLKIAIYSGRDSVEEDFYQTFDYVKIGRYDALMGPLNSPTTNQRLYKNNNGLLEDITCMFWRKNI